jgi:cytochrome c-type biogenesis protein CcmH/NrfG
MAAPQAERQARDLYWEVISEDPRDRTKIDANIQRLKAALALNPYLAEPNTLLAQMYLVQGNFDDALVRAGSGVDYPLAMCSNVVL